MSAQDDLETIAAYRRNLPQLQGETIAAARDDGMTWRDIARILDITERGAYKVQRAWEARQH